MHDWNCGIKLFKLYFICAIWSEIAFGFTYFIQGFAFRLEISAVRKKDFHSKITWCCLLDLNRQQFFVYVLCNINTCWHSFLLRKFTIVRPWLSTRWHESMFFSNISTSSFSKIFQNICRYWERYFNYPTHLHLQYWESVKHCLSILRRRSNKKLLAFFQLKSFIHA